MSKLIPDSKAPKDSTDYIYGERMDAYEDRMNFFLDEKVKVDKKDVEEKDKATVDGLEALVQRFTEYRGISVPGLEEVSLEGSEARVNKLITTLIQLAKDTVTWLLNFINNRLARLDNRHHRALLERKANGVKEVEVAYPMGIRRLLLPLKVSTDPNWVFQSLEDVNTFYKSTVAAYKFMTDKLRKVSGDIDRDIKETIEGVAKALGASHDVGSNAYRTAILPGNRRLTLEVVNGTQTDQIRIYFTDTTVPAKLKSQVFTPNTFMIDKTIATVGSVIKEVRSNQSTVSQLVRTFEKEASRYSNEDGNMDPNKRKFINWLIRYNKRLMNMSVQYTINSCDSGIDFIEAGIR